MSTVRWRRWNCRRLRSALRERYRYVFIDEYQDSSAIQEAIVGSFAREDGLFLVGDVKQSIYRFRQAEPSLFLQKAARFDLPERELERRIDLQKNFRLPRQCAGGGERGLWPHHACG